MLAQVLHRAGVFMGSDFTAYYESNYFQKLNELLLKSQRATWDMPLQTVQLPQFSERGFISEYLSATRKPQNLLALLLKKKWGWKDPRNTFTLGSWMQLFPNLKAIHIVRNGIDTSLSLYERNMMLQPKTKWHSEKLSTLSSCFQLWEEYVLQGKKWKQELNDRYLEIHYEELIQHNENAIKNLKIFTGVNVRQSLQLIADKERGKKDMEAEIEELKNIAALNNTFKELGYVA
jgi:hypothetical protein